jgi:hypothetical protein
MNAAAAVTPTTIMAATAKSKYAAGGSSSSATSGPSDVTPAMCPKIMAGNDQKKHALPASLNLIRLDVKYFFERRLVCATFLRGCIQALIIRMRAYCALTTAYLNRISTAHPEHDCA